jgi:hypothetical protein
MSGRDRGDRLPRGLDWEKHRRGIRSLPCLQGHEGMFDVEVVGGVISVQIQPLAADGGGIPRLIASGGDGLPGCRA